MSLTGVLCGVLSSGMDGLTGQRRLTPLWTPAFLTGLAADLLVAEARAAGGLWQDAAKTVPAVVATDPVRVAVGVYAGVEWTAPSDSARPTLVDDGGGKWLLSFDGVDDLLVCSVPVDMLFAAARAAYTAGTFAGFDGLVTGGEPTDADVWLIGNSGTGNFFPTFANFASYRFNGAEVSPYTAPMSGVPGTCCLTKSVASEDATPQVGRDRANASRHWSGGVRGVVVLSAVPSADELESLESYLGGL